MLRTLPAFAAPLALVAACAGAQDSRPARPAWYRGASIEVQDSAGDPVRRATVKRVTLGRPTSESRVGSEASTYDVQSPFKLDWGGYETGKDGRTLVMVPAAEEMPGLIVFKPGFRSVEIAKPGSENRVVLREGVEVRARLPAWLRLPPVVASRHGEQVSCRNAILDFLPASDEVWWKSQSVSLYDRQATTGGQSPREVRFRIEPGRYTVRFSLVTDSFLETKLAKAQIAAGTLQGPEAIAVSPPVVTIPDTKDPVPLDLGFDRAAYEESGFADLPEVKPEPRPR